MSPDRSAAAASAAPRTTLDSLDNLRRILDETSPQLQGLRSASESLAADLEGLQGALAGHAQKQSSLRRRVAELEQELQLARDALVQEREAASKERERLIEEQDEFIAGLLEERAAAGSRAAERQEHPPRSSRGPAGDELEPDELQRQLRDANDRIERLLAEQMRSRDVLRRLQRQRDEAQQAVNRLTTEARTHAQRSWSPSTPAAAQPPTGPKRAQKPQSKPVAKSVKQSTTGPPRKPAGAQGPSSPLAVALAQSDPSKRKPASRRQPE
jgi:chromosome segregation ATPase